MDQSIRCTTKYILFICLFVFTQVTGQKKDAGLQFILNENDIDGGMLFFDENNNDFFTNSKAAIRGRHRPGSMFHLFSSLMFYQLGIVKDSTTQLKWDGERTL